MNGVAQARTTCHDDKHMNLPLGAPSVKIHSTEKTCHFSNKRTQPAIKLQPLTDLDLAEMIMGWFLRRKSFALRFEALYNSWGLCFAKQFSIPPSPKYPTIVSAFSTPNFFDTEYLQRLVLSPRSVSYHICIMSSCSEPTIIEYARFHSLIRDHRLLDPLALIPEQEDEPNLFEDPQDAPKIELSHDFSTNEKLVLSKEAAKLLSSCTRIADVTAWNIEETLEIRQRACKNRCEIPILKTEHELDMGEFRRRVEPDLAGFNLPYEKVDEESDEGLAWPPKYYELAQEVDAKSKREKLEISRDIFVYMQSIVTDSHIDAETELLDNELESRHVSCLSIIQYIFTDPRASMESLSQSRHRFFQLPQKWCPLFPHRRQLASNFSLTGQALLRGKPTKSTTY